MLPRFLSKQAVWPSFTPAGLNSVKSSSARLLASRLVHARGYTATHAGHATSGQTNNGQSKKSAKNATSPLWPRIKSFTSFTISGFLVVGASGLAGLVIYLLLQELFSPSGDTRMFNRAVSMVESDTTARELLQCKDTEKSKERLKAYGELLTDDKWTRNRPIASTRRIGKDGKEHYYLRFHVESKQKLALIHVEARESEKRYTPDLISMYMDVPGQKRYYFIKPQAAIVKPKGFLGVNWGPRT
ncbi:LANO_0D09450g1_1 [Lachancea nothofagi CBS 11611]|uniref:Mitochondrial import inner membrane translocase subunit Tim21 n=1 Tax=Lachancea nothofagi CBS 11611 TaxID=1266666 RepID=A0A1G4JK56_9SACH|nr:LANO_0D09450g1_1 [Lachancea nothofagi CBS 11611]